MVKLLCYLYHLMSENTKQQQQPTLNSILYIL